MSEFEWTVIHECRTPGINIHAAPREVLSAKWVCPDCGKGWRRFKFEPDWQSIYGEYGSSIRDVKSAEPPTWDDAVSIQLAERGVKAQRYRSGVRTATWALVALATFVASVMLLVLGHVTFTWKQTLYVLLVITLTMSIVGCYQAFDTYRRNRRTR
jgi:hypothetical protein